MPEVTDYQAYAGTAAPINFNGLVRQYYLRSGAEVGDIQVNLVDKHHRSAQSHAIATRVRPALAADRSRATAPTSRSSRCRPVRRCWRRIVAEIYGPDATGRQSLAKAVRAVFETTPGVVDVDDSSIAAAPRTLLLVDRRKAALLGVPQAGHRRDAARPALAGDAVDLPARPEPSIRWRRPLQLPPERQGELDALLAAARARRRRHAWCRCANWSSCTTRSASSRSTTRTCCR